MGDRAADLAASRAYAEQVATDPEIARRVAEARHELATGTVDPANVIGYDDLMESIRERRRLLGDD